MFTSNKQPVAAMVPLKNVNMESLALSYHPDFIELIEKAIFLLTFLLHLNQYNTDIDLNTVAHCNEKLQQQCHFRKDVSREKLEIRN